jgi:hypothetical protein
MAFSAHSVVADGIKNGDVGNYQFLPPHAHMRRGGVRGVRATLMISPAPDQGAHAVTSCESPADQQAAVTFLEMSAATCANQKQHAQATSVEAAQLSAPPDKLAGHTRGTGPGLLVSYHS